MVKVIVHIDLNAFFVRCEELKDPSLENKAVAVGHEGRGGIVSTCSYEARKFGVHSGMAMFQAKALCPQLTIKPVDFHYYNLMSKTFMNFIRRYTKLVEEASIDECYADFTDIIKKQSDVTDFFITLQNELFKETGLKCSIGVAPTKFLAKMGSDLKKPLGLTIIRRKDVSTILYPLKVEDMFGIGKKTAPRLKSLDINTIGDLANKIDKEDQMVKDILGKFFYVVKDWLHGYGSDEIIYQPEDPKSIGNSTTMMHDSNEYEEIKYYFSILAKEVSSRAKKENKLGNTIQIVVKDTSFKSHNKSLTFENPTNDEKYILNTALKLYEKNFTDLTLRLVGITLQNLIDPREMVIQMTLFDYEKHEEESATKLLISELNRKLKKPILKRASEVDKK